MTRKTRREIERAIERLFDDTSPENVEVTSTVTTVTEDDVDDDGNTDLPEPEPPDGYQYGLEIDTASDVVTVREVLLR